MKTRPTTTKFEITTKKRPLCQAKRCSGAVHFNKMNQRNTAISNMPADYYVEVYVPKTRKNGAALLTGAFCRSCVDEEVKNMITPKKREYRRRERTDEDEDDRYDRREEYDY